MAVAAGMVPEISPKTVEDKLTNQLRDKSLDVIRVMVENSIDQMKVRHICLDISLLFHYFGIWICINSLDVRRFGRRDSGRRRKRLT